MKNNVLSIVGVVSILFVKPSNAQTNPPVAISIGYFGPIPFEPGFRIGLHTPLKSFENSSIVLNTHAAFFFRNRDNSNLLFGAELGWRHQKDQSKNVNTLSIGSAYVMQWEVTSFTVNLQGETVSRERSLRHQFLPTINYAYGRQIGERWTPFVKLGLGYTISTDAPNSGLLLWEFGTTYSLN
ncbi:MAG: hypothetical protein P8P74_18605 [Crocinitomicaceae bacterium]|nr:hypothetical protein [Crocinitomicaceae bacterium]